MHCLAKLCEAQLWPIDFQYFPSNWYTLIHSCALKVIESSLWTITSSGIGEKDVFLATLTTNFKFNNSRLVFAFDSFRSSIQTISLGHHYCVTILRITELFLCQKMCAHTSILINSNNEVFFFMESKWRYSWVHYYFIYVFLGISSKLIKNLPANPYLSFNLL